MNIAKFIPPTFLVCLFIPALLFAQGQSETINDGYKVPDLNVEVWAKRFESEGREVFDFRNEIVKAIGLKPGQTVADVGAGTGLYIPLLAKQVGKSGQVFAIDIIPKFIAHIEKQIKSYGLEQVKTVLSTETSITMPENSLDMVFTSDTYHHFSNYQDMLASIHRALKANGQLIIVEFDIGRENIPQRLIEHVGGTKEEFTRQIENSGFRLKDDMTLPEMKQTFIRRFVKE